MRKIMTMLILGCNVLCALGKTYYVDSKIGNDANDGLSSMKAWQSLTKVNDHSFAAGDSILFKRDEIWEGQLLPTGSGMPDKPVVFSAYGKGALPEIKAAGHFRDALLIKNVQHIVVEYLALSNFDRSVVFQKTGPTGVRILAENIGTLHNIRLAHLYIHDINGDNKKGTAEGCGIFWDCQGPVHSNIEHLLIEDCTLERVDRNGIRGNGTFGVRSNWFPNRDLVIRNSILKDIGGDGIVIKAFDTALVEHNKLFHTRARAVDNAVAIWPHSSDHTLIQYNEVAYTKNENWANDGQSFDVDGNCRNTTIQYNYSHDNDGGFVLVISDVINKDNVKTVGNIIQYNLSVNDGLKRKRLFNFAGVTDSTIIKGNIFYNDSGKQYTTEIVDMDGKPVNLYFEDNYFDYTGKNSGVFSQSPQKYKQTFFVNNRFVDGIVGSDNLPNLKEGEVPKRQLSAKPLTEFPWKYMPKKLKKQMVSFPQSLYLSVTQLVVK
ncbi:right-handed parallel beta-helix repeat-containing protein [Mucilaginibacter sp. FT3.2]|uniref:right-handed parallel beta-helix repeat-containing protein n=1 Tax=Mucilaginibacter sp. FT3.2 TaxID=2723090 RepID=UPI0016077295|nr:right-handed parallel beta-helix repeat-containing protein [Mucilaginibacter sp. FT3.2]MBB6234938.1 hypothetical protein [Mucilaginibacter sp. FT3.2]